ncbi:hypothetical protein A9Q81_22770 [Gammaproteobacteria bacterium 42_54_T18]|nr:hypothetical protein A9Q81_22770 [Gammaproteobacteria bacterium 42_54_T18]
MFTHITKAAVPPAHQAAGTLSTDNITREFSSIHKYFENQALRSPHTTALITEDQSLTYDELDARANQLAANLEQTAIGPGSTVAIFLPRSIDAVVALLACLKSGAAQLPISMNYPISFIEFILDDAKPNLILTGDEVAFDSSIDTLRVDRLAFHAPRDLPTSTDWPGDAPAWILYTSGSTGRPKAVKGLHHGIIQRCESLWALQPFLEHEVAIQNTALTVVDSHWEIWGPLSKGIPVVLLDDDINQDPRRLVKSLRKFKVTRICLVPSLLRSMLTTADDLGLELPHLKQWIVSGEPLSSDLVRLFYQSFPDAILRNQYGLTETSADITSFDTSLLNSYSMKTEFVPIGSPFPGVDAHILDENLMPVADGVEGELFIAGDCVVDGYLNRPDLSAERFLTNTFFAAGGSLLSTGDLAYRLENGDIFVSGRADRQVKVRGYRVELDGLESLIASHVDVISVAAISYRDTKGHTILITYVQTHQDADITQEAIREFCADNLPKYMIPHKIFFLDDMPRTPSGKINRKALPAVPNTAIEIVDRHDLSITKDTLRRIWCRLLDLPDVDSADPFFQAGGDSLMLIAMLSEVRTLFRCDIPLQRFVLEPTIENICRLLNDTEAAVTQSTSFIDIDEIQAELSEKKTSTPFHETPLSVAQSSIYLHEQFAVEGNPYGITISAVLSGKLNLEALEAAVTYVVKTDPILSARIFMTADGPQQRIHDNPSICFDVIRARRISDNNKERYIKKQITQVASMRLDLKQSPPLYMRVLKIADKEAVLIIQVHHLICDGQSMRVFVQRLSEAYTISATSKPWPAKEPDLRFPAYCRWENQLFGSDCIPYGTADTPTRSQRAVAAALEYWGKTLPDLDKAVALKSDMPEGAHSMSVSGREVVVEIDKDTVNAQLKRIPLSGVTPFHLFFASYSSALYQTLGYSDQAIGFVTGLRPDEHGDALGCYVTALPCFIDIGDDTTNSALLTKVGDTLWGALAHGRIPFEVVLNHLRAKGQAMNFRGFQTVVSFDDLATRFLQLRGVHAEPLSFHSGFSKFPLSFNTEVTDTGFVFSFEYRTALYREETINRLAQTFLHELFSFSVDS